MHKVTLGDIAPAHDVSPHKPKKCLSIHVRKPLGVRRGSISSPIESERSRLRNEYTRCVNVRTQSMRCKMRKLVPALAVANAHSGGGSQIPNDLVSSDFLGPSPPSCRLVLSLPMPCGHNGPWPPSQLRAGMRCSASSCQWLRLAPPTPLKLDPLAQLIAACA